MSYRSIIANYTWWGPWCILFETNGQLTWAVSKSYEMKRRVSGGKPNLGQWNYIVLVGTKSYMKSYVNGLKVAESTEKIQQIGITDEPLYIGRQNDGRYFEGIIDEVRIYNRALAEKEIKALYQQGQSAK